MNGTTQYRSRQLLAVVALAAYVFINASLTTASHQDEMQYCVIGAGPAGLQIAYFLDSAARSYVVLERASHPGSFFDEHPRSRTLISINKRNAHFRDPDFLLRHDWNSLLSNDSSLRFTKYSKKYFPKVERYQEYLQDYAQKLHLRIRYNTEVQGITRRVSAALQAGSGEIKNRFIVDTNTGRLSCETVIVAIGIDIPYRPVFPGSELASTCDSVPRTEDAFEGKNVLIFGKGNSALELADFATPYANHIHIASRSVVRFSFFTHYVGDLRALNSKFIDQYQLKSLDGFLEGDPTQDGIQLTKDGSRIRVSEVSDEGAEVASPETFPLREPYDHVVFCTGYRTNQSIFSDTCRPQFDADARFPVITPDYESVDQPGIFFAGNLVHSLDYRKSSGGFIHGFRYLAGALFNVLQERYHGAEWPHKLFPRAEGFIPYVVNRMNTVSSLYQMFGVLSDVIVLYDEEGTTDSTGEATILKSVKYYTDVPLARIDKLNLSSFVTLTLEYGKDFHGPRVFSADRAISDVSDAALSQFLHPIFRQYDTHRNCTLTTKACSEIHMIEDFLTQWNLPQSHVAPLTAYFDALLRGSEPDLPSPEGRLHPLFDSASEPEKGDVYHPNAGRAGGTEYGTAQEEASAPGVARPHATVMGEPILR